MRVEKLKRFCMHKKINGVSLLNLWEKFSKGVHNPMPRSSFERGMLILKKQPAIAAKEACLAWGTKYGHGSYDSFCREGLHVTRDFWNMVFPDNMARPPSDPPNLKLPDGWGNMHWVKKEAVIKSVSDIELLEYMFSMEHTMVLQNLCRERLKQLGVSEKVLDSLKKPEITDKPEPGQPIQEGTPLTLPLELPESPANPEKKVRIRTANELPFPGTLSPSALAKVDPGYIPAEDYFKRMLPGDWATKSRSDRIEFVKSVKHLGFRDYILKSDVNLAGYFSLVKKKEKEPSQPCNLYVTLYKFPRDNYPLEARKLLKDFVKVLGEMGRANLQYVECINPSIVEIREVR